MMEDEPDPVVLCMHHNDLEASQGKCTNTVVRRKEEAGWGSEKTPRSDHFNFDPDA